MLDIYKLLPRTNCRECGFATCMAFAAALSTRKAASRQCPGFSRPISLNAVYPVFDGKGNLLSTVSIDLDTDPAGLPPQTDRVRIENPEEKPNDIARSGGSIPETGNDSLPAPLTKRELAVLRLIAQGATNKEISDLLDISPHTVKSHVIHIFNKLGVNDRTQAAVCATRHNLV